jgi:SprT protein
MTKRATTMLRELIDEKMEEFREAAFLHTGEARIKDVPVDWEFSIKGRKAGQARIRKNGSWLPYDWDLTIRLNEELQLRAGIEAVVTTLAHEACHVFAAVACTPRRPQPHGKQWKSLMRALGFDPNRCHSYDLPTATKFRTFRYVCSCMEHEITSIRHNRIQSGKADYHCKYCKGLIRWADNEVEMAASDSK